MPSLHLSRSSSLILALTLALLPGAARAAVISVVPEKFTAMSITDSAAIDPWALTSGDGSSAAFTTTMTLPVGATITKLLYFHWGSGVGSTRVMLYRTKMGRPFNATGSDFLMEATSSDAVAITLPPQIVSTMSPQNPSSDLVVDPGYRYFLVVLCSNNGNWVNGVRVFYNP